MATRGKTDRRQDILQCLAMMLETPGNGKITTAALARQVGVTEAALYKHFPSKARMYEGLLDFVDDTLFSRINAMTRETVDTPATCGDIMLAALTFGERNPGITRLLCGDALHGENERLQVRAGRVFERLHSTFKQQLQLGEVRDSLTTTLPRGQAATLLVNILEGRLHQYVRSGYRDKPVADWDQCWPAIAAVLFRC